MIFPSVGIYLCFAWLTFLFAVCSGKGSTEACFVRGLLWPYFLLRLLARATVKGWRELHPNPIEFWHVVVIVLVTAGSWAYVAF